MHKVTDFLPKDGQAVIERMQSKRPSTPCSDQAAADLLRSVLSALTDMRLIQKDEEQYRTWAASLQDLSDMELRRGLHNARDFKGYFSLPAFRDLCKVTPENLGLPSAHAAYLEACQSPPGHKDRHKWSHPAVYHAGCACGWFELANLTEQQAFPRFRHAYEALVNRVLAGESLTVRVPEALENNPRRPLTPEQNRDRLNAMRKAVNL